MKESLDGAMAQIREKGYAEKYRDRGEPIHLIGMAFGRKKRNLCWTFVSRSFEFWPEFGHVRFQSSSSFLNVHAQLKPFHCQLKYEHPYKLCAKSICQNRITQKRERGEQL
ncbi:MAG: PD-(D/E)XK nuclease domain-containing protein [Gammaproteobacteria bacterium]|nr:PD-(D/E)XK nuclease domain-containing protein [Gammaproteobacteria bacterium]